MTLGIDIDGTITDINELLFEAAANYAKSLNKKISDNLPTCDPYNNGEIYKTHFKFNYEELKYFLSHIQEKIQNEAKPRPYAKEMIHQLHCEGYKIIFITARDSEFHENPFKQTKTWLEKNKIYFDELIVNARNKSKICLDKKVDILIEDNIYNCLDASKNNITSLLISQQKYPKIETFSNWKDIYNYLKKSYSIPKE